MEEDTPIPQIIRMDQVFAVGGTYNDPSEFTRKVNKNLMIFPDDMYELLHGLVFIDFWDKLGIWLPVEEELPEYAFDFKEGFLVEENKRYFEN